jgi:hypothetical protein
MCDRARIARTGSTRDVHNFHFSFSTPRDRESAVRQKYSADAAALSDTAIPK